jgi:hypothetical protein
VKQAFVDIGGILHSRDGLRFDGVATDQFVHDTEHLEVSRPGVRNAIVSDANNLYMAPHRFAEAVFLVSFLSGAGSIVSVLAALAVIVAELFRLLTFGSAMVFLPAKVSALLRFVFVPAVVVLAFTYWKQSPETAVFLAAFALLQGWLSLFSSFLYSIARVILSSPIVLMFGERYGGGLGDLRVLCLAFALESHEGSVARYGQ